VPTIDEQAQIDSYAELLVKVGVNLQPGQQVVIRVGRETAPAPLEVAPFVHALARQSYASGASYVHVLWADAEIARLSMQHASDEQLASYPAWENTWLLELVAQNAALIMLSAPTPEAFQGVDPRRLTIRGQAMAQALHPFSQQQMVGAISWLIAAVPTSAWAARVFPDLPSETALEKLWALIRRATRLDADNPVAAWVAHLAQLRRRCELLEQARLRSLHYIGPGTDLTVDLLPESIWTSCASSQNKRGAPFVPNMPSDEVFTTPLRNGGHGTVRSTLPLYYNGTLIEDIVLRFEQGKIVEATSSTGIEVLRGALDTDEGARYLGEIALVPVDSPVASLRTVFFNTLFDENASCHLAFGRGIAQGLRGGNSLTADELLAQGVNESAVHVDLMIGSEHLDLDGITASGQTIPLLRQGRWAEALG
jgi:aminopeptidase